MSVKTVNTRIKSKYDLLTTWQSSTLEILPGEVTVAYLPTRVTDPTITTLPSWVASTPYNVGDKVTQGGSDYICIIPHTSASSWTTVGADSEADKWLSYTNSTITKPSFLLKVGVDFPAYDSTITYGIGDTVTAQNSNKYRCIQGGAGHEPSTSTAYWSHLHTDNTTAITDGLWWRELPFVSALAADVYGWAKQPDKPDYSYLEITNFATGVQLNDHQYKIVETSTGSGKFDLKVSIDNGSSWNAVDGSAQIDISALDADTNTIYRFNTAAVAPTWVANTYYPMGSAVTYQSGTYMCTYANTDASWTAGHWAQLTTQDYIMINLESTDGTASPISWSNPTIVSSYVIATGSTAGSISVGGVDIKVNGVVTTSGNQTIGGVKTFSNSPIVPTPTTANQAANKSYVDSQIAKIDQFKYHVSTAATDTPLGVKWNSGSVIGTLQPSYDTEYTIYLVKEDNPEAGTYIEYLTVCIPAVGWTTNTNYKVGDIVYNSNTSYICKTDHTSTSSFDTSKWLVAQIDADAPVWATGTAYKVGDEVIYNNTPFVCTTAHTSALWDASKWAIAGYKWEKIGSTATDLSNYSTKKYQGKLTTSTSSNVTTVTYSVQQSEISTTSWSNIGDVFTYTVNSSTGVITLPGGTTTYTKAALDAKISTVTITDTPQYTRGVDNDGVQISSVTNGTTKTSTALMYADMYIFDCGTSTINTSGS